MLQVAWRAQPKATNPPNPAMADAPEAQKRPGTTMYAGCSNSIDINIGGVGYGRRFVKAQ